MAVDKETFDNLCQTVYTSTKMACLKYSACFIVFSIVRLNVEANVEANNADLPDAVNAQFEFLVQRIEQLEIRNGETERKMDNMQKEFRLKERTLTERISRLERQNDLLRTEKAKTIGREGVLEDSQGYSEFSNTSRHLGGRVHLPEANKNENKIENTVIKETKTTSQQTRAGNQRVRSTPEREVAFFATVTPHDLEHLGHNQNLVFDNALTNTGNAYHTTHGIFTAPVDGTYVFSATVAGDPTNGDGTYYAHFDVGGRLVAKFIGHHYEQSTQMIVLQLKAGDDVSVKNYRSDDHILGDTYSTFSGFLLYQHFGSSGTVVGK